MPGLRPKDKLKQHVYKRRQRSKGKRKGARTQGVKV